MKSKQRKSPYRINEFLCQEMNQRNESEKTFNMQKLLREWTEVKMFSVQKEVGHRENEAV